MEECNKRQKPMKPFLPLALTAALSLAAQAADYTVFRVCEDKHVIRTSDGAEAGRVEYIVLEPTSHRVISTVITGGVLGERLIAVPVESFQMTEREITLTQIDRTRLIAAPVIERTALTTTAFVQPAVIERSFTHFGARLDGSVSTQSRTSTDVNVNTRGTTTDRSTTRSEAERTTRAEAERAAQAEAAREGKPAPKTAGTPDSTKEERMRRGERKNQPEAIGERTKDQSKTPAAEEKDKAGKQPATPEPNAQPPRSGTDESSQRPGEPAPTKKSETDKPGTEKPGSGAERSEKGEKPHSAEERSERANEKAGRSTEKSEKSEKSTRDSAEQPERRSEKGGNKSDEAAKGARKGADENPNREKQPQ